jgi:hypothetical protein
MRWILLGVAVALVGCSKPEVKQAHEEMIQLRSRIRQGMSVDDVLREFNEVKPKYVRFAGADKGAVMFSQSAIEGWASKEWVMWVSLLQGRAAAIRIRTQDSTGEHPHAAPEDVIWTDEEPTSIFSQLAPSPVSPRMTPSSMP